MAKLQPDEAFGERHGDCSGEEVSEGVEGGNVAKLAGQVRTRHSAAPRSAHLLDRAFVARPRIVQSKPAATFGAVSMNLLLDEPTLDPVCTGANTNSSFATPGPEKAARQPRNKPVTSKQEPARNKCADLGINELAALQRASLSHSSAKNFRQQCTHPGPERLRKQPLCRQHPGLENSRRYLDEVRCGLVREPDSYTLFLTSLFEPFAANRLTQLVRDYINEVEPGKRGSCHLFRHICATLMLEGGADVSRYTRVTKNGH